MPVEMNPSSRTWTLSGGNTSYVLHRDEQDRLLHLYWGPRLGGDVLTYNPSDYSSCTLTVETLRFALQALLGFIFLSSFWYFYVVWCCIFIQYVV